MSTYVYLWCLDHDPPLQAEGESGQHLYDLPQIRADLANRDGVLAAWEAMDRPRLDQYFRNSTLWFLAKHPRCSIGIRDEYGNDHALVDQSDPAVSSTGNPTTEGKTDGN